MASAGAANTAVSGSGSADRYGRRAKPRVDGNALPLSSAIDRLSPGVRLSELSGGGGESKVEAHWGLSELASPTARTGAGPVTPEVLAEIWPATAARLGRLLQALRVPAGSLEEIVQEVAVRALTTRVV